MCTKEQIQEAKKYLGEQGYGTGSNFTLNVVANLMAEYAAKNCVIPAVMSQLSCDGCKYHNTTNDDLCGTCGDTYKNKAT